MDAARRAADRRAGNRTARGPAGKRWQQYVARFTQLATSSSAATPVSINFRAPGEVFAITAATDDSSGLNSARVRLYWSNSDAYQDNAALLSAVAGTAAQPYYIPKEARIRVESGSQINVEITPAFLGSSPSDFDVVLHVLED